MKVSAYTNSEVISTTILIKRTSFNVLFVHTALN